MVSSPTATTANANPSPSHSRVTPGGASFRFARHGCYTIKDRAPSGVSAVLINPRHMYPDLALFIDAAQERLLKAIDGERSAGEILQSAVMSEETGRAFFQCLWEHDLIMFDAKRPK